SSYSKPLVRTLTLTTWPLYLRARIVPGVGRRRSPAADRPARDGDGGKRRKSASLASSLARLRARTDRSPSASACKRQAMRLTSQVLGLERGGSPKSLA